jgi:hypothetical protein
MSKNDDDLRATLKGTIEAFGRGPVKTSRQIMIEECQLLTEQTDELLADTDLIEEFEPLGIESMLQMVRKILIDCQDLLTKAADDD